MTKSELIDRIYEVVEATVITKKSIQEILDVTAEILREELTDHGRAMIPGICHIRVRDRAARRGRNPRTGDVIAIPARRVPVASFAGEIVKRLNQR
ncbi:MAG TPA: HU family DNA-binding protein [Methylococcus sp.]|nr:HU family DNA-binding protein [Methylococcus sp.]